MNNSSSDLLYKFVWEHKFYYVEFSIICLTLLAIDTFLNIIKDLKVNKEDRSVTILSIIIKINISYCVLLNILLSIYLIIDIVVLLCVVKYRHDLGQLFTKLGRFLSTDLVSLIKK